LGEILALGLLFKGPGKFLGEIGFVSGVIRVYKGFDVDVLDFQTAI
jgi:hypothetical protein